MSMSTTSTTTYILSKYSRAYPSQTPGSQESDAEWQHFTNPTIRLTLDMKKSGNGELESYRVRISWSLDSGQDGMDIDQRDVLFEDLELLSFSSIPSQSFSAHGLPLKAVYRDAVVGIRYMHPKAPVANPSYRRFQMNFQSSKDASSFIEAVRHVCPCKANQPTQPSLARASTVAPTQSSRPPPSVFAKMLPPPLPTSTVSVSKSSLRPAATMAADQRRTANNSPSSSQRMSISSLITAAQPMDSAHRASNTSALTRGDHDSIHSPAIPTVDTPGVPPTTMPASYPPETRVLTASDPTALSQSACYQPNAAHESGPVSSLPPTINLVTDTMPMPESSNPVSQPMDVDIPSTTPVTPVLPKVPGIYDLAGTELEALVAEVIREDDFVKLLENLDAMWRVKIMLGK